MPVARWTWLAVSAALWLVPVSADTARQTWTFAWSATRTLALDITIGRIQIEGANRDDVEMVVERTAPGADALKQIAVAIEESPERVDVRIVQPDGGTDPALVSNVVLRVPTAARLGPVRVMEGGLTVERFRGTLTADVRRGPISGRDVSGTLRLEAGIGSITLENARLDADGLLRLRAFNGDVRLRMPGPPENARVMALALNGTIESDLPMTTKDTWGPRWSEATLGTGVPVISIDVITGRIDIRTR